MTLAPFLSLSLSGVGLTDAHYGRAPWSRNPQPFLVTEWKHVDAQTRRFIIRKGLRFMTAPT
ncbi:hypothetical protein [Falsirhodobacter sp. 1013]|uniref:hypothetical protein n=1 Tax=Falsirhodobacter sp. 1013 TaxID=3417566 RepID=UPI003EBD9A41